MPKGVKAFTSKNCKLREFNKEKPIKSAIWPFPAKQTFFCWLLRIFNISVPIRVYRSGRNRNAVESHQEIYCIMLKCVLFYVKIQHRQQRKTTRLGRPAWGRLTGNDRRNGSVRGSILLRMRKRSIIGAKNRFFPAKKCQYVHWHRVLHDIK